MSLIEKRGETMTHRERVKRTFEFEKTDRVTIGYDTNEGIHGRWRMAQPRMWSKTAGKRWKS